MGPQVAPDPLPGVETSRNRTMLFDNFFTSYHLLQDLHGKEFKATGTIRENRILKCPLQSSKVVEGKERGFYKSRLNEFPCSFQWKDNEVVYIASNHFQIEPTKLVKRYSQQAKKRIDAGQSYCFHLYNKIMGDVDLLD